MLSLFVFRSRTSCAGTRFALVLVDVNAVESAPDQSVDVDDEVR